MIEIERTDNPDILIQITKTEISISMLEHNRSVYSNIINDIELKLIELNNQDISSEIVRKLIDDEISKLHGDILTYTDEINKINLILNG